MKRSDQTMKIIIAALAPVTASALWVVGRALVRRRAGAPARPVRRRLPAPRLESSVYPLAQQDVVVESAHAPGALMEERNLPRSADASDVKTRFPWPLLVGLLVVLGVVLFSVLQDSRPVRGQVMAVPGGDVERGRRLIAAWGCGSCHVIPGITGAHGKVGPKLDQMGEQAYIAGMLPNTPENIIRWIMDPQEIQPGNVMPDTGVTEPVARDMAAYLYSLRR